MSDFFSKTWPDTFRRVLVYGKEQEPKKKLDISSLCTKLTFLRFDRRKTFLDAEKYNSKRLFSNDVEWKSVTRG